MGRTGALDHIDVSVSEPDASIPVYDTLLRSLGYRRWRFDDLEEFTGPAPRRATWILRYPGGGSFAIEVRPSRGPDVRRRYDRHAPGPHHLAFQAGDRATVDRVHEAIRGIGGEVLDPPHDYGGERGYAPGYYAVFFADPDGLKLEVVHLPLTNPD